MALVKYPKTPNKHTSLKTLRQILTDNCIAASGQEYNEEELRDLIQLKEARAAEKLIQVMERKNKNILEAWERVEEWRKKVKTLQRKISKERKKYGF